MNRATITQGIVHDFKKTTQEILTSQIYSLGTNNNILDFIEMELLRSPFCSDCGDSSEIEIFRRKYVSDTIISSIKNISSEYLLAVIPSKRGYPSESIVISVSFPWKYKSNMSELGNTAGIIISFSKHLTKVNWLSKDVYILFTDMNIPYNIGISAFLKDISSNAKLQRLNSRIRTAFCIEILSSIPTKILVDIESLDGLLPIQDLPVAIIREIESYYNGHPIYIEPRLFWDSLLRQATNGGSERPHSAFLRNNIQSLTISLVDESSFFINGDNNYSLINKDANKHVKEFVSIYPISNYEILKFLEGIIKIISNLHDELNHSTSFYYFTSYSSSINSGVYLSVFFPILLPTLFKILTSTNNKHYLLVTGATITPIFYLINYFLFLFMWNYLNKNTGLLTNDSLKSSIYLKDLFICWLNALFFLLTILSLIFGLTIKLLKSYFSFGQEEILDIIYSIKTMNNVFVITFSIFISIINFSLSVIITPTIVFLVNIIFGSGKLIDITFSILNVACLIFSLELDLSDLICKYTTLCVSLMNYIFIKIVNILIKTNYIEKFGPDVYMIRNSLSMWNSVLGREFFCGKYSKYFSNDIKIECNSENLSKIKLVFELYKTMKTFPILQWLTWVSINHEINCTGSGAVIDILGVLTKLIADSIHLKSTTFQYLIFGIISGVSISTSLLLI